MGKERKNKQINPWRAFGMVGVVGVELSVLLLLGIWLGKQADQYFGTTPVFLIVGMVLGLIIGIWSVIKLVKPFIGD